MNKKILYVIVVVILIAGLFMGITRGFNLGLRYDYIEKVEISIDQQINKDEINEIAKEVFNNGERTKIQTIEIFEDSFAINVNTKTTDEQLEKLVNLVNEKYSLERTVENVTVIKVPQTSIKDIVLPYALPSAIILIVSALYMMVRFHKLGALKVFVKAICYPVIVALLIASVYAIGRIAINELTMPIAFAAIPFTLFILAICMEKELVKLKDKKDKELVEE